MELYVTVGRGQMKLAELDYEYPSFIESFKEY